MKKFFRPKSNKKGNPGDLSLDRSVSSSSYNYDCSYGTIKEKELPKLHRAVWTGDVESVRECIKEVNSKDKENRTPLHLACSRGNDEISRLLIDERAKVNIADNKGCSPLMKAVQVGAEDCVQLLLDNKADLNAQDLEGNSTLHHAALYGYDSVMEQLLNVRTANVNLQNKNSMTPFFIATTKGHVNICQQLIRQGADIDLPDAQGCTPLMSATSSNNLELVKLLLESNANWKLKDVRGWTADDIAMQRGHEDIQVVLTDFAAKAGRTTPRGSVKNLSNSLGHTTPRDLSINTGRNTPREMPDGGSGRATPSGTSDRTTPRDVPGSGRATPRDGKDISGNRSGRTTPSQSGENLTPRTLADIVGSQRPGGRNGPLTPRSDKSEDKKNLAAEMKDKKGKKKKTDSKKGKNKGTSGDIRNKGAADVSSNLVTDAGDDEDPFKVKGNMFGGDSSSESDDSNSDGGDNPPSSRSISINQKSVLGSSNSKTANLANQKNSSNEKSAIKSLVQQKSNLSNSLPIKNKQVDSMFQQKPSLSNSMPVPSEHIKVPPMQASGSTSFNQEDFSDDEDDEIDDDIDNILKPSENTLVSPRSTLSFDQNTITNQKNSSFILPDSIANTTSATPSVTFGPVVSPSVTPHSNVPPPKASISKIFSTSSFSSDDDGPTLPLSNSNEIKFEVPAPNVNLQSVSLKPDNASIYSKSSVNSSPLLAQKSAATVSLAAAPSSEIKTFNRQASFNKVPDYTQTGPLTIAKQTPQASAVPAIVINQSISQLSPIVNQSAPTFNQSVSSPLLAINQSASATNEFTSHTAHTSNQSSLAAINQSVPLSTTTANYSVPITTIVSQSSPPPSMNFSQSGPPPSTFVSQSMTYPVASVSQSPHSPNKSFSQALPSVISELVAPLTAQSEMVDSQKTRQPSGTVNQTQPLPTVSPISTSQVTLTVAMPLLSLQSKNVQTTTESIEPIQSKLPSPQVGDQHSHWPLLTVDQETPQQMPVSSVVDSQTVQLSFASKSVPFDNGVPISMTTTQFSQPVRRPVQPPAKNIVNYPLSVVSTGVCTPSPQASSNFPRPIISGDSGPSFSQTKTGMQLSWSDQNLGHGPQTSIRRMSTESLPTPRAFTAQYVSRWYSMEEVV